MKILSREELATLTLDPVAIRMIPESMARLDVVLPCYWNGTSLRLIVPTDTAIDGNHSALHLDLLKFTYTIDYADREDLRLIVDLFYTAIYAEIDNCFQFRFRCPKRFAELESTANPLIRHCSSCQQDVYFCRTEEELSKLTRENKCVAFYNADDHQDFMGLPMDDF